MKIKTKVRSFKEVMEIPVPSHRKPMKQWFLFRLVLRIASIPDLFFTRFKCKKIGMEKLGKKQPCLVLMNHSSFIDLEIASTVLFPRSFHIVCTTDGFVGKNWLMRCLGCIPTKKFMQEAADYYAQLCAQEYPSTGDMINYSVVLRMSDRHGQARSVLEQALLYDVDNYRIHMALGSVCYDLGDRSAASRYCSEALQAWKADTSPEKLSESSREIQSLMELSRRLGGGGI